MIVYGRITPVNSSDSDLCKPGLHHLGHFIGGILNLVTKPVWGTYWYWLHSLSM